MNERDGQWYAEWQDQGHPVRFDDRATLDDRNLLRNFNSFNDVQLLNERIDGSRKLTLVEIGCATGEFYRYLSLRYPHLAYHGLDISKQAVHLAQTKYPHGCFLMNHADESLANAMSRLRLDHKPEILYAKDVVHHQTQPLAFLSELLASASEAVIVRVRTRDVGPTEFDPERSCQYQYGGWAPYIVLNIEELVASIRQAAPASEIVIYRHHMILGGHVSRFLPKDCYLKETGTAETAVGVFYQTQAPGHVTIEDRVEGQPRYTIDYQLARGVRLAKKTWRTTVGHAFSWRAATKDDVARHAS